ncbi:MAG: AAA family ATPase [Anaerolineae bacterium]
MVKFAGDALLALWPVVPDATDVGAGLQLATHRAAQCALTVQQKLHHYEPMEDVRLSLRVGVGAGDLFAVHLGGVNDRWEFLVAGAPLAQLRTIKQQAQPGDAILSPEAWALVEAHCLGHPLESGDVLLGAVRTPPAPVEPARSQLFPVEAEAALRAYIPGVALARLAAGQTGWMAELRRVTVVFLNLPDLNYTASIERAQEVMRAMQATLYRYEGSINKLSVDDQGVTLVAALGLPPFAHEDDAVRGARAALAMQAVTRDLGLRGAIGVATGQVFCGSVGNSKRREYTIVGDMVNLATRLMQAAPDDILCDAATVQAAQTRLPFEPLPPIRVKGKTEPVAVYRPLSISDFELRIADRGLAPRHPEARRHKPNTEMVGRTAERALLLERLQIVLKGGVGGAIVIEGEPGIGKSRLVEDLLGQAQGLGVTGFLGAGDAIEKSTPYHAWRLVFSQLFDLDPGGDLATRRERVLGQLAPDPNLLRVAPLLNVVLPLDLPDNDLTEHMLGQVRAENTRRLLLSLLVKMPGREAARSPRLLILEDAQWLDSASWALALLVNREVRSMLIVIATRPMDDPLPLEYSQLSRASGTQWLQLEPLPAGDSLALVCQRLGVAALPDAVRTLIVDKAEGHPFFSEELAYALRDAGLILIEDGECRVAPEVTDLSALNLPNTVQGVITGRIDRLTPSQQLTLKVASVIGRVFAFRILREIHPIAIDKPHLSDYLSALERLDITPLETPEPDLTYIFKHIITREVAYNLMLFSQRRQLHRAVAEWYERAQTGELSPFYPLLAHHWSLAEDTSKALDYLEKAGEQALRGGAYQEAASFFKEALRLAEDERKATGDALSPSHGARHALDFRRARWERQLGEAYLGLGELPDSRRCLEQAVARLGWPSPTRRGRIATTLLGQILRQALHRRLPRRFVGRDRDRADTLLEAVRAYERLIEIYYFSQERPLLLNAAFHALNLSESAGPSPELARAYANTCVVAGLVPLRGLAHAYAQQALATAEHINQLPTQARVLSRTGLYDIGIGHWAQAREALEQAIQIADHLNDQRQWGESAALRAYIVYHQGQFTDSRDQYIEVYARARQSRNLQFQAWGQWGQAHSLVRLGQLDEAVIALKTALEIIAELNDRGAEILATGLLAAAYLRQGERQLARSSADAVIRRVAESARRFSLADLEGHAGAAEVFLTLWETGGDQPPGERRALAASARVAIQAARHYARIYTIGRPRAWLLQGWYDWLSGDRRRAAQAWRKSLSVAGQLDMPYEEGRAHYEIGRHLDARDPARAQHLSWAGEVFDRIGAVYEAARAQAAQAP